MQRYRATHAGKHVSMTVEGRVIQIHDTKYLKAGEEMWRPDNAFVLLVVASPDDSKES